MSDPPAYSPAQIDVSALPEVIDLKVQNALYLTHIHMLKGKYYTAYKVLCTLDNILAIDNNLNMDYLHLLGQFCEDGLGGCEKNVSIAIAHYMDAYETSNNFDAGSRALRLLASRGDSDDQFEWNLARYRELCKDFYENGSYEDCENVIKLMKAYDTGFESCDWFQNSVDPSSR